MKRSSLLLSLVVVLFFTSFAAAQVENPDAEVVTAPTVVTPPPPKTDLEAVATRKGTLVVGGFSDIGSVQIDDGSGFLVTAVNFTDSKKRETRYGLIITVHQTQGNHYARSYVDEDEIDDLLNNLQMMDKLNRNAAGMDDFVGRLRTKGDLELGNVPLDGSRALLVRSVQIQQSSGEVSWAVIHVPLSRLSDLTTLITSAKQKIDQAKANR